MIVRNYIYYLSKIRYHPHSTEKTSYLFPLMRNNGALSPMYLTFIFSAHFCARFLRVSRLRQVSTDTNRAIVKFYFSILYPIFSIRKVSTLFPSPLGTSYFLISATGNCGASSATFPSPLGTSYFLMRKGKNETRWFNVSVPSGDFLFSNFISFVRLYAWQGFRPLWGVLIF